MIIRDKVRPLQAQYFFFSEYGMIPIFKGRLATLVVHQGRLRTAIKDIVLSADVLPQLRPLLPEVSHEELRKAQRDNPA